MKLYPLLTFWSLIFTFSFSPGFGQSPQGKLFLHTAENIFIPEGELGCISYPDAVYQAIDSIYLEDMEITGNTLITAGEHLIRYQLSDLQIQDSITGIGAKGVGIWGDKIVTSHYEHPYLSVWNNDLSIDYALDSQTVIRTPTDFLVYGDTAVILYGDKVQLIDLNTQDTLPLSFPPAQQVFGSYMRAFRIGDSVYVNLEWYTAVPRVTLYHVDFAGDSLREVRLLEFTSSYYEPVPANRRVYLKFGLNYYDFPSDSLFRLHFRQMVAIAYDPLSENIFTTNKVDSLPTPQVFFMQDTFPSAPVNIPDQVNKARFWDGMLDNIGRPTVSQPLFSLFPNPARQQIQLTFDQTKPLEGMVAIQTIDGKKLVSKTIKPQQPSMTVEVGAWPDGIYLVQLITSAGRVYSRKFLIGH